MSKKDIFGDEEAGSTREDFEQMLNESFTGGTRKLKTGDNLRGQILSIGKEEAFVSTGTPVDGAIPVRELLDDKKELKYKVGDMIDIKVVRVREGEILLKPAGSLSSSGDLDSLEDAFDMELPVEGRVTEAVKGGFRVQIQGKMAFCPISQIDSKFVKEGAEYIGQKYDFIITQFEERGRNIVVSRRKILDLKKAESEGEFLQKAKIGDILHGKITRMERYGAFVSLDNGLDGLIPISELAWGRINDPSEIVQLGQEVDVALLRATEEGDRVKISLSLKQAGGEGDPWMKVPVRYPVGSQHEGTIERKETYGLFVNLAPGITGLMPKSKWRDLIDGGKYESKKKGEKVMIQIDEINLEDKRLTLSPPNEATDMSWQQHSGSGKTGLGTMADLLKDFKPNKK